MPGLNLERVGIRPAAVRAPTGPESVTRCHADQHAQAVPTLTSGPAGLLDGRRATTHWKSSDDFRRLYPAVDVDQNVLYTDDGNVLTSAGEAAGIDLCLHMIRRDHGSAVANDVARRTVVPPHRDGGQAQFTRRFRDEVGMSPGRWLTQQRIERARELLENTDLPVDRIAADTGFGTAVSLRQHLHTALGVSPTTYRSTFRGPTSVSQTL